MLNQLLFYFASFAIFSLLFKLLWQEFTTQGVDSPELAERTTFTATERIKQITIAILILFVFTAMLVI